MIPAKFAENNAFKNTMVKKTFQISLNNILNCKMKQFCQDKGYSVIFSFVFLCRILRIGAD